MYIAFNAHKQREKTSAHQFSVLFSVDGEIILLFQFGVRLENQQHM